MFQSIVCHDSTNNSVLDGIAGEITGLLLSLGNLSGDTKVKLTGQETESSQWLMLQRPSASREPCMSLLSFRKTKGGPRLRHLALEGPPRKSNNLHRIFQVSTRLRNKGGSARALNCERSDESASFHQLCPRTPQIGIGCCAQKAPGTCTPDSRCPVTQFLQNFIMFQHGRSSWTLTDFVRNLRSSRRGAAGGSSGMTNDSFA